ncbi:MAG: ectonucleotide pyrophosphatase/phosphodiesterase [Rikenellaceae bacterium]
MKKRVSKFLIAMAISVVGLLVCACCSGEGSDQSGIKRDRHVVILSTDGFRWDYTLDAYTPTLDSLRRVGTYARTYPVFPSNTFPNHYSMATGLHPNNHGVTNNSFYDEEQGRILSVFRSEDVALPNFWGGEPIWNSVELQGGVANIFMWPGSESVINGRQATVWTPYDHDMDYYERADMVVNAMKKDGDELPNLVMWYMPDPDGVGHKYGPNSRECIARVEYIDRVLRYFFRELKKTPHFDNIDVIITSDHGMTQLSPDRYLNMFGAVDSSKIEYVVPGTPFGFEFEAGYIDEAVERLNALGNLRAYRADAMPKRYQYGTHPTRCPNVVIIPDMGWKLDYREIDSTRLPSGGSHGYDPFEGDMQMIFFGAGPSFKRGYIQNSFQDHNVYLIICHLLGIKPAENDGRWRDIKQMFVAEEDRR